MAGLTIMCVTPLALVVNVIGLFKPENRKFAIAGLVIDAPLIGLLLFTMLMMFASGLR